MIKKPTKKVTKKPAKKATKSTVKRTVKRTTTGTASSTSKVTPLTKILETWEKAQGPLPSLHEIAGDLEDVCNTLNDVQHVMDSALDDCLNMTNDARAMSLLHLAHGMVKESVDTLDGLFMNLYRISRASLK